MRKVLLINASPKLNGSFSRDVTNFFIENWLKAYPTDKIIERDVGANPIPHLEDSSLEAVTSHKNIQLQDHPGRKLSQQLIAELKDADVVVLGLPMHNYSIPSSLKAYFDHIAISGVTWHVKFTDNKPIIVLTTSGGPNLNSVNDFVSPYIKSLFAAIELTNVMFIGANGVYADNGIEVTKAKAEIVQYITKFKESDLLSATKNNPKVMNHRVSHTDQLSAVELLLKNSAVFSSADSPAVVTDLPLNDTPTIQPPKL